MYICKQLDPKTLMGTYGSGVAAFVAIAMGKTGWWASCAIEHWEQSNQSQLSV